MHFCGVSVAFYYRLLELLVLLVYTLIVISDVTFNFVLEYLGAMQSSVCIRAKHNVCNHRAAYRFEE